MSDKWCHFLGQTHPYDRCQKSPILLLSVKFLWVMQAMGFAVRVRSAGQIYGPTCHQRDRPFRLLGLLVLSVKFLWVMQAIPGTCFNQQMAASAHAALATSDVTRCFHLWWFQCNSIAYHMCKRHIVKKLQRAKNDERTTAFIDTETMTLRITHKSSPYVYT